MERRTPADIVFIRREEIRLDNRPTTEEHGPEPRPNRRATEVKSGIVLPPKVSELRSKLSHKAKQEPRFRFYALYDRIYRLDVLMAAWWLVLKNHGAAGVDGVSCQDISIALTWCVPSGVARGIAHQDLSAATGQACPHPQAGRAAATAGNSHGQRPDRPNGGAAGYRADLRGGLPGQFVWVSSRSECASGDRRDP